MSRPRKPIKHGTLTGYINHKCRCGACRAAKTAYRADVRDRHRSAPPEAIPHGTRHGYDHYGCRCGACRAAEAAYRAAPRGHMAKALADGRIAARKYGCQIDPALTLDAACEALLPATACYICGTDVSDGNWEPDHRTPLSRGGAHTLSNLALACVDCNRSKNSKTEAEFLAVILDVVTRRLTGYPTAAAYLASAA